MGTDPPTPRQQLLPKDGGQEPSLPYYFDGFLMQGLFSLSDICFPIFAIRLEGLKEARQMSTCTGTGLTQAPAFADVEP